MGPGEDAGYWERYEAGVRALREMLSHRIQIGARHAAEMFEARTSDAPPVDCLDYLASLERREQGEGE